MATRQAYCKKCPFKPEEVKPFLFAHGRYYCSPECPDYREVVMDSRVSAAALDKVIRKDLL